MRNVLCTLMLAGCSASAPPPSNAMPQTAPAPAAVEVPPAEPAAPTEPAGLLTPTRPARGLCELKGPLDAEGVELAGLEGGPTFGAVANGELTLSLGENGSAFAEVRLPTSTLLRGFASRQISLEQGSVGTAALVYPRRWLAFGGVYHPGRGDRMLVRGTKGSKIIVAPYSVNPDFELDPSAESLEVSCADISLTPDPDGELRKQVPQLFRASGKEQFMWLTGTKPVAIAAVAGGPASGALEVASDEPLQVVVLERRGPHARIRYDHVAGWIEATRLSAKEPKPLIAEIGGLGLVGMGAATPEHPQAPAGRRVSCNADVRLVAVQGAQRFVVGSIAPNQGFVINQEDDEFAYLAADGSGVKTASGARLAVPMRDAMGCAEAAAGSTDALGRWPAEKPDDRVMPDAVSVLPGAPSSKANAGKADSGEPGSAPGAGSGNSGPGEIKTPRLRMGAAVVSGRLPPEVVSSIVRQNIGTLRLCYEQGLKRNPALDGRLAARFIIGKQGTVTAVSNAGSTLSDQAVVRCVLNAFYGLSFPQPEGGIVDVVLPIQFNPE